VLGDVLEAGSGVEAGEAGSGAEAGEAGGEAGETVGWEERGVQ